MSNVSNNTRSSTPTLAQNHSCHTPSRLQWRTHRSRWPSANMCRENYIENCMTNMWRCPVCGPSRRHTGATTQNKKPTRPGGMLSSGALPGYSHLLVRLNTSEPRARMVTAVMARLQAPETRSTGAMTSAAQRFRGKEGTEYKPQTWSGAKGSELFTAVEVELQN